MKNSLENISHLEESPDLNGGLFEAAGAGDVVTMEALLAQGAEVNSCREDHETPLAVAVEKGHVAAADMLLRHGADMHIGISLRRPFWLAQNLEQPDEMSAMMLRHMRREDVFSKFFDALERSDLALVRQIASLGGFDANQRDYKGDPGLVIAAESSKDREAAFAIMKLLVAAGADVNAKNRQGRTALDYALCEVGFGRERVKLLLDAGADIFQHSPNSGTAYGLAESFNDPAVMKMMEPIAVQHSIDQIHGGTERAVTVRKLALRMK